MMTPEFNTEVTMSQPTPVSLRPHHEYKSWTTDWYDDQKHRRTKRFGKEDDVTEREARARFNRWLRTEWEAKPFVRNPDDPSLFTVRMLAETYRKVAATIFVKDGEQTGHMDQVNAGMDALVAHYADLPASDLSNPRIARLRDKMIFNVDGEARSVKTVNGRLFCIKAAAKWARERDLITAEALVDVLAVAPLRAGRCAAKPPKEVLPVDESVFRQTRAKLPKTLQDMVDVHWLTGMRPGEVCAMRGVDIDRKERCYTPSSHKMEHKGKVRRIPIGPVAWAIIEPRLTRNLSAHLFTPIQAQAERLAKKAEARARDGTPAGYGNGPGTNRVSRPKVTPGVCYSAGSYRKAIRHACRAVEKELRKADPKAKFATWHPNQIRHTGGTRVRDEMGYEAAIDFLGHNAPATTAIYAERSYRRAKEIAEAMG